MNKINKITNKDDIVIESDTEICNEFNDFFVNVGNNLEIEHIHSDTVNFNDKNQSNDNTFLNPISSEEISEYIDKIKNYNSYYEHGLTNYIFKNISISISIPLSLIFNKSLLTGDFPLALKKMYCYSII